MCKPFWLEADSKAIVVVGAAPLCVGKRRLRPFPLAVHPLKRCCSALYPGLLLACDLSEPRWAAAKEGVEPSEVARDRRFRNRKSPAHDGGDFGTRASVQNLHGQADFSRCRKSLDLCIVIEIASQ